MDRARQVGDLLGTMGEVVVTVDGGQRIVLFNREAARIFGCSVDEVLGRPLDILLPLQSRAAHGDRVAGFGRAAEPRRLMREGAEIRGRRKDGTEFPAEAAIFKERSGEGLFYTAVLRDVSERKHAEEQLRQSQKMEAVGQLTGGIAHDFNNRLAVVLGNLDLVRERAASRPELTALLDPAIEAAVGAAELTQRLLAFSRQQPLDSRMIDVGALVGETVLLLRRTLGETIRVEAEVGDGLWPCVVDPFFTTKGVGEGTGLGLSMVHGFVRQSGGHIDISSEPGGGTEVRLHLPRAPGAGMESGAAPSGRQETASDGGASARGRERHEASRSHGNGSS